MAQAKSGDVVKVHYTGTLDDGTIFDTSTDREPLEFKIGDGQLIPAFEEAVVGMEVGESKTAKLTADEAYGQHRDDMMITVPKNELPADLDPNVGDMLQMIESTGNRILVTVVEISESSITLDANHPLAGKNLTFDIELKEILQG